MGPPAPSRELLPGAGVLCFPGSRLLILVPKAWRWTPVVSSLRTMPLKKNSLHKEAGQHRGQTAGLEARQSSCGILTQALTSHVTSAKGCHLPHIPSLPLKNEGRKAAPTDSSEAKMCGGRAGAASPAGIADCKLPSTLSCLCLAPSVLNECR